jgi:hypothetical protein
VKRVAIERKKNLSPADFVRDHLQGVGKPVIVTDAMQQWPALSKWTFEFIKEAYGADFGMTQTSFETDILKVTRISAYIEHLDRPTDDLPGFWVNANSGKPLRAQPPPAELPHYLLGWYAFQKHPELYQDIQPPPYFVADWLLAFSPAMRDVFEYACGHEYWSLYIGPEGTLSKLHRDFWCTHACLAQIQGRKKAIMFSPEDSPFLYEGQVDPERPDFERFELFERATAYECVIEPGEMLFMPPDWWHHVRALEKSMTVSHNFFNDTNVNEHLAGIMSRLPGLLDGFEKHPEWRESLAAILDGGMGRDPTPTI